MVHCVCPGSVWNNIGSRILCSSLLQLEYSHDWGVLIVLSHLRPRGGHTNLSVLVCPEMGWRSLIR